MHGNKYDYSELEYKHVKEYVTIICPKHGKFKQTPSNHLHRKSGCPQCAKHVKYTHKYFDEYPKNKNIKGALYLVEFFNDFEKFIKIGITKHKNTIQRFKQGKPVGYNVNLIIKKDMNMYDAFLTEQYILQKYKTCLYQPLTSFSGKTECFIYSKQMIDNILELIENK